MAYATRDSDNTIGDVRGTTETIRYLDITVTTEPLSNSAEYVVRLNGRVIKRLNSFQAERYGILAKQ